VVDLKASDGTVLKASYFTAASQGPAHCSHQTNPQRKAWARRCVFGVRAERASAAACRKGMGPARFSCGTSVFMVRFGPEAQSDSSQRGANTQEGQSGALPVDVLGSGTWLVCRSRGWIISCEDTMLVEVTATPKPDPG
jgi:hypothetical protein